MKLLGQISPHRCKELENIYLRKKTLENLLLIIAQRWETIVEEASIDKNGLVEKLISDYTAACEEMNHWWRCVSEENSWKYNRTDSWSVDFTSREVFLLE